MWGGTEKWMEVGELRGAGLPLGSSPQPYVSIDGWVSPQPDLLCSWNEDSWNVQQKSVSPSN
ncbi:hypothetical protein JZ751_017394 [Albula glossodonta]|uniref:Uncharacterized protein n=1 Tax=Albula glossodonta TaxID=121402 RepID=A0A8T2PNT4_9TELE|nr:hypothetical protein JZ751_017394 [Albula glossodonta]